MKVVKSIIVVLISLFMTSSCVFKEKRDTVPYLLEEVEEGSNLRVDFYDKEGGYLVFYLNKKYDKSKFETSYIKLISRVKEKWRFNILDYDVLSSEYLVDEFISDIMIKNDSILGKSTHLIEKNSKGFVLELGNVSNR